MRLPLSYNGNLVYEGPIDGLRYFYDHIRSSAIPDKEDLKHKWVHTLGGALAGALMAALAGLLFL